MQNAEEEPSLFDATLAYDDDSKQSTTDILSAWGPFFHKILIDIVEEEHVHKFLSDFFIVQDVEKVLEVQRRGCYCRHQFERLNWNMRMCIPEVVYSWQP